MRALALTRVQARARGNGAHADAVKTERSV